MREYAKVAPTFWTGTTGKALRARGTGAMVVGLYLMTAPGSNMLGLYYQPILYMAHETGLGLEGAWKGLRECVEAGLCKYDEQTEMVWVVEMAAYQIADKLKVSDNRCAGIQRDYDALPSNPFLSEFFDRYQAAFHLTERRGREGASKALPSKEQEQEQEQEKEKDNSLSTAPPLDLTPVPTDLTARRAERLSAVTADAIEAYNRILGKPDGLLTAVSAKVGRAKRQDQVRRSLQTASEICDDQFGDKKITPEFWTSYFAACSEDDFTSGRGPYTGSHANWRPDFEYLTRPATMLKVFERATDADAAA